MVAIHVSATSRRAIGAGCSHLPDPSLVGSPWLQGMVECWVPHRFGFQGRVIAKLTDRNPDEASPPPERSRTEPSEGRPRPSNAIIVPAFGVQGMAPGAGQELPGQLQAGRSAEPPDPDSWDLAEGDADAWDLAVVILPQVGRAGDRGGPGAEMVDGHEGESPLSKIQERVEHVIRVGLISSGRPGHVPERVDRRGHRRDSGQDPATGTAVSLGTMDDHCVINLGRDLKGLPQCCPHRKLLPRESERWQFIFRPRSTAWNRAWRTGARSSIAAHPPENIIEFPARGVSRFRRRSDDSTGAKGVSLLWCGEVLAPKDLGPFLNFGGIRGV